MAKNSDAEWEQWGKTDPYFGVITLDKYRTSSISETDKKDFFATGKAHVDEVMSAIRNHIDESFLPERVLDFGCGVGRLVIPFSGIARDVVGVDVSDSMLKEAEKVCSELSINNATFFRSDDTLSKLEGSFDFIHSFIVFQHIPVARGHVILDRLLGLLANGGIGALHFTYAKSTESAYSQSPAASGNNANIFSGKPGLSLAKKIIRFFRNKKNKTSDPEMQMNSYDCNKLLMQIQRHEVDDMYIQYTNHQGSLGLFIFFKKNGLAAS